MSGFGFRAWDLEFRISGLEIRVWGSRACLEKGKKINSNGEAPPRRHNFISCEK